MEVSDKIIEQADLMFQRYGIRSVTMDDIARPLGISKKTIYQYFKDKDEIVLKATEHHLNREYEMFDSISKNSANAVEEVHNISICARQHMFNINPAILMDMQKYHRAAWNLFMEFKEKVFKQNILATLERGKKEGFFRPEINAEVLATLRIEQIQMSFDPKIFPPQKFDFKEIQNQFLEHFLHGILTPKGRKLYQETQINYSKNPN